MAAITTGEKNTLVLSWILVFQLQQNIIELAR